MCLGQRETAADHGSGLHGERRGVVTALHIRGLLDFKRSIQAQHTATATPHPSLIFLWERLRAPEGRLGITLIRLSLT